VERLMLRYALLAVAIVMVSFAQAVAQAEEQN
jgi:hypothetical protein